MQGNTFVDLPENKPLQADGVPPVAHRTDELESVVNSLDENIKRLIHKITPVLGSQLDGGVPEDVNPSAQSRESEIARVIESYTDRLRELVRVVADVGDRVEV